MRIETGLPLDDWRKAGDAARVAEEMGFDGVVTAEIAHDPFAPLVLAALATSRIGLGTAIALCFPRSPMVMANIAWDLQSHSGGRFTLGLGAQVKGHNERRFGLAWSPPVPRLREYVESLRAIWRCWEKGEKLDYPGDHYRFSLMTPEFSPQPTGQPPIRIQIAAVGPAMLRLAGRVCDGVRLHGFATRKYLEEVALPELLGGLARSRGKRSDFEIWGGGFIATGPDEAAVARALEWVRYRVAFYGSTRSYHPVLEVHGWQDLGMKLHAMSKRGEWKQMAAQVPDDVVREFAAVGTWDELPGAIERRFGGLVDTIALDIDPAAPSGRARELIQDLKRIASPFSGHARAW